MEMLDDCRAIKNKRDKKRREAELNFIKERS